MINICLVGFGRLGFRYLQAISKLTLKINLYIVDKNTKRFKKLNEIKNSINKDLKVSFSKNFKKIPKKIDLIIVSTTCDGRSKLISKINKELKFKNIILEKPLSQSIKELNEIDNILYKKKNCWVNLDKRFQKNFSYIKKKIDQKYKISMKIAGDNWGLCCNSLHYVDFFYGFSGSKKLNIIEKKKFRWIKSKRKNYYELINGNLQINAGSHCLNLYSNKKVSEKTYWLKVLIKNKNNRWLIVEKPGENIVFHKGVKKSFKAEYLSIRMTKIIFDIIKNKNVRISKYKDATVNYRPLIQFFENKWKLSHKNATVVPIT